MAEGGIDRSIEASVKNDAKFVDLDRMNEVEFEEFAGKLRGKRVAIEFGPGNQTNSLGFATKQIDAEVVIGVEPDIDEGTTRKLQGVPGTETIMIKGDGENLRFKKIDLAYAQVIAPDSDHVTRMIDLVRRATEYFIVIDPRTLTLLEDSDRELGDIQRQMLRENGITNPKTIDWIMRSFRGATCTRVKSDDYLRGVEAGKYPYTAYAAGGDLMVFSKRKER